MPLIKCPDCGKEISSRAVACPFCGCPSEYFSESMGQPANQPQVDEPVNNPEPYIDDAVQEEVNDLQIRMEDEEESDATELMYGEEKQFEIGGRWIILPPEIEFADTIRKPYEEAALECVRLFTEEYESSAQSIPDMNRLLRKYLKTDDIVFQKSVRLLMVLGIDEYDSNRLMNMYQEVDRSDFFLKNLRNRVNAVNEYADNLSEYREAQRNSRSQWVGGGYGVNGAIKGAMTAAALNAGADMAHGVGDTITDFFDQLEIDRKEKDIIQSAATKKALQNAVYYHVFDIYYVIENILIDNGILPEYTTDQTNNIAKANNYFEMALFNPSATETALNVLFECANSDPYEPLYYLYMDVLTAPTFSKEIQTVREELCITYDSKLAAPIAAKHVLKCIPDIRSIDDTNKKATYDLISQYYSVTEDPRVKKAADQYLPSLERLEMIEAIPSIEEAAYQIAPYIQLLNNGDTEYLMHLSCENDMYAQDTVLFYFLNRITKDMSPSEIEEKFSVVIQHRMQGEENPEFLQGVLNNIKLEIGERHRFIYMGDNKERMTQLQKDSLKSDAMLFRLLTRNGLFSSSDDSTSNQERFDQLAPLVKKGYPRVFWYFGKAFEEGRYKRDKNLEAAKKMYELAYVFIRSQSYKEQLIKLGDFDEDKFECIFAKADQAVKPEEIWDDYVSFHEKLQKEREEAAEQKNIFSAKFFTVLSVISKADPAMLPKENTFFIPMSEVLKNSGNSLTTGEEEKYGKYLIFSAGDFLLTERALCFKEKYYDLSIIKEIECFKGIDNKKGAFRIHMVKQPGNLNKVEENYTREYGNIYKAAACVNMAIAFIKGDQNYIWNRQRQERIVCSKCLMDMEKTLIGRKYSCSSHGRQSIEDALTYMPYAEEIRHMLSLLKEEQINPVVFNTDGSCNSMDEVAVNCAEMNTECQVSEVEAEQVTEEKQETVEAENQNTVEAPVDIEQSDIKMTEQDIISTDCGTALPARARFCGNCGTALPVGARFCGNCGAPVQNEQTPKTSSAIPDSQLAGVISQIQELISSGQIIKAVKVYRDKIGGSLAEAKDFVYKLRDKNQ